jgi:hypothetical protein
LAEIVAAKPSARTDEEWGNGFITPSAFIALVYEGTIMTVAPIFAVHHSNIYATVCN